MEVGAENKDGYFQLTRTATYGFLAALPLFLAYEVLIFILNEGEVSQIRVGADVWIKEALASIGGTTLFSLGILVLVIGLAIVIAERRKRIPLRLDYFAGMAVESLAYAVVVAYVISTIVGIIFSMGLAIVHAPAAIALQSATAGMSTIRLIVLSFGAGLYEELVFRVVLVGGLFYIFKLLFEGRTGAYIMAALLGAVAFSAVHYMGTLGDPFDPASFTFRFLFGLALNFLYLARGFGIAAWTHALYDVLVVTQLAA
jgi:Type II CAAX prenyl endopeptidase Rce1-like